MGVKFSAAVAKRRGEATKAKDVDLKKILTQTIQSQSVLHSFSDLQKTQQNLDAIPISQQNLLSHLTPGDLLLFVNGDNALRKEILVTRPPSYAQRLACIHATDQSVLRKWADELILAGTAWDGMLSSTQTSLSANLAKMRQEKLEQDFDVLTVPKNIDKYSTMW